MARRQRKVENPDAQTYTGRATCHWCMPDTYVLFDVETTGLFLTHWDYGYKDRIDPEILELAAIKVVNNEIVDTFETMVYPYQGAIPQDAQDVNHITMDMVADAPYPEEVLREFMAFCDGFLLMGYYTQFDIRVLRCNLTRYCPDLIPEIHYFDCYELFRYVISGGRF